MLVAVLVYLVVRARQTERPIAGAARPIEIVRELRPTATRAIAPADLSVAQCAIKEGVVEVQLRNAGSSNYRNVMLKITVEGKGAAHGNHVVGDTIAGGTTAMVAVQGLDLPRGARRCTAQVLYADVIAR
jgi:hypothetical protein